MWENHWASPGLLAVPSCTSQTTVWNAALIAHDLVIEGADIAWKVN